MIKSIYFKYLLLIIAFIYLHKLFIPQTYIASNLGDSLAHAAATNWFCENFFSYNFKTDIYFAPDGINLSGGYDTPILNSFGCLLYKFGPVAMFNFIALMQFILIITSSYLVANKYIKNKKLIYSFILLYSFSSYFLARSTGHINLLSNIWSIPIVFYFFDKINLKSFKETLFSFIILSIILLSSWQNWPIVIPIVIFFILKSIYLEFINKKKTFSKIFVNLLISGIVLFIIITPFIIPIIKNYQNSNKDIRIDGIFTYNADVLTFLIPWEKNYFYSLFKSINSKIGSSRNGSYFENYNSIDIIFVLFFLVFLIFRLKNKNIKSINIILIGIVFYILSLGPKITIAGKYIAPLTYYSKISNYPPFSMTRTPARLGIVFVFCVYLYTTICLDEYLKNNKHKNTLSLFILIYAVLYSTFFSNNFEFPSTNYKNIYPFDGLSKIKNDTRDTIVLNIPIALGADPSQNFLQLYHNKRIISGYVSYASQTNEVLKNIKNSPIFSSLSCSYQELPYIKETNDIFIKNMNIAEDPELFFNYLTSQNINYIIINKNQTDSVLCKDLNELLSTILSNDLVNNVDENQYYKIVKIDTKNLFARKNDNLYFKVINEGNWSPLWNSNSTRWIIGTNANIQIYSTNEKNIILSGEFIELSSSFPKTITIKVNNSKNVFNTKNNKKFSLDVTIKPGNNILSILSDSCNKPIDLKINDDKNCYSVGIKSVDYLIK